MAPFVAAKINGFVVDTLDDGLTVLWPNGTSRFFHYVWLRHCCFCDRCGSTYTGTSTLLPSDVPMHIKPLSINNRDNENLDVVWSGDEHRSSYAFQWLLENAYSEQDRADRKHQPTLWNSDISSAPPAVDFEYARNHQKGLLELLQKLRDYGFVIARNGPREVGREVVAKGYTAKPLGCAANSQA